MTSVPIVDTAVEAAIEVLASVGISTGDQYENLLVAQCAAKGSK